MWVWGLVYMNTGVLKGIGLDWESCQSWHGNKALISCSIASTVFRLTVASNSVNGVQANLG